MHNGAARRTDMDCTLPRSSVELSRTYHRRIGRWLAD